ncbi:MAG: succinate dehydrogenase, hydrophobic membrane anchor protein [Hyphomicrobiales bacterium]
MSLRTPLSKVRGLGSARSGAEHFWRQRLTAIANIPLMILFVVVLVASLGGSHASVSATVSSPPVAILFLLIILSGVYHMYLGMQTIIEDYVHGEGMKIAAILGNTFFSVIIGLAGTFAILKLSFGG